MQIVAPIPKTSPNKQKLWETNRKRQKRIETDKSKQKETETDEGEQKKTLETTYTSPDIATYRLNRPKGPYS